MSTGSNVGRGTAGMHRSCKNNTQPAGRWAGGAASSSSQAGAALNPGQDDFPESGWLPRIRAALRQLLLLLLLGAKLWHSKAFAVLSTRQCYSPALGFSMHNISLYAVMQVSNLAVLDAWASKC